MEYACLQGHSAYQFGDSCLDMNDYARRAKKLGYSAIGVADKDHLYALPELFDACRKNGLHAVAGCEFRLDHPQGTKRAILYIENEIGYSNICYLLSLKKSGLALSDLSGFTSGITLVIPQDALGTKDDERILFDLTSAFAHHYIGLQIRSPEDMETANGIRAFAADHGYQTVAFPKVCYASKRGAFLLKVLAADRERRALTKEELDPNNEGGPDFLLAPTVLEKFYLPEEIQRASTLAYACSFDLFSRKRGGLISATGTREQDDRELEELAQKGLEEHGLSQRTEYVERLKYELSVIEQMGFSSYFLIVADFVQQARTRGIAVGPGRGSACGCLTAFLLNITAIDPLRYGLTFERFLNPKRVTMPDIDIDFQDDRRDELPAYLKSRYGERRVSQIVTFHTYKARSALNAAGAAFGIPAARIKSIQSLIRGDTPIQEALKTNPTLAKRYLDPYFHRVIEIAAHMEGLPVETSIHPVGCLVSDRDIYESCPMSLGQTGVCEYEYPYMERLGFLKFDLLSLRFLTFIKKVEELIVAEGEKIPNYEEERDDPATYQVINSLKLLGIFQLGEGRISQAVQQIAPQRFDDLVALVALYRPATMKNIPVYASRKRTGRIPSAGYPLLDDILRETYGIIVYQEQVLRIAHEVAGLDMSEADMLRRAISKKDEAKMASYREKFTKGCLANGVSAADAKKIYDLIERFGEYGFNKSHAVAYSLISFETAYLKAHFPDQFYQVLSATISPTSPNFTRMVSEMNSFGIHLVPADVNTSALENRIENGKFYLGLNSVKSIPLTVAQAIIAARGDLPFKSLEEFLLRLGGKCHLDGRIITLLSQAALLDSLCGERQAIEDQADELASYASLAIDESMMPALHLVETTPLERVKQFLRELDATGISLRIELSALIPDPIPRGYRIGVVTQPPQYRDNPVMEVAGNFGKYQFRLGHNVRVERYDIVVFKPSSSGPRSGYSYANDVRVFTPKGDKGE